MPRIRMINPALWQNEKLGQMPGDAVLLFIGLWTLADREGRLKDSPRWINAQLFPFREPSIDVDKLLEMLNEASVFIERYEVDGERFIQVANFRKYQKPHAREAMSTIPAPPKAEPRHAQGAPKADPRHTLGTTRVPGIRYTVYGNQNTVTSNSGDDFAEPTPVEAATDAIIAAYPGGISPHILAQRIIAEVGPTYELLDQLVANTLAWCQVWQQKPAYTSELDHWMSKGRWRKPPPDTDRGGTGPRLITEDEAERFFAEREAEQGGGKARAG